MGDDRECKLNIKSMCVLLGGSCAGQVLWTRLPLQWWLHALVRCMSGGVVSPLPRSWMPSKVAAVHARCVLGTLTLLWWQWRRSSTPGWWVRQPAGSGEEWGGRVHIHCWPFSSLFESDGQEVWKGRNLTAVDTEKSGLGLTQVSQGKWVSGRHFPLRQEVSWGLAVHLRFVDGALAGPNTESNMSSSPSWLTDVQWRLSDSLLVFVFSRRVFEDQNGWY